jgi:2-oxoisovalerate dehydrogenase E1 component
MRGRRGGQSEARLLELYEWMLTGRILETRILEAQRAGLVDGPLYPGVGQEAAQVGFAFALERGDVLGGNHRGLLAALVRGVTLEEALLDLFGKAAGPSRGRSAGVAAGVLDKGVLGVGGASADAAAVAVGCALAFVRLGEARVAMACTGEGATSSGTWHESVNTAAVLGLPVVFAVENNQYAYSSPNSRQFRLDHAAGRAAGYGIPGVVVDGNDVLEVYAATREAVERARAGEGPSLVEAVTFRYHGHHAGDAATYVDPQVRQAWIVKDPIPRFEEYLGRRKLLDEARRAHLEERVRVRVGDAIAWAREQADPDPTEPGAVLAVSPPSPPPPPPEGPPVTMREALNWALEEEMGRDETVIVLGQDVGALGGAFGVTRGLLERYGDQRVVEVPAAGPALAGAAVGAALQGLRPVAEVPHGDHLYAALGILFGHAACARWEGGREVPLVLRVPFGAGLRAGPHLSGSPEAAAAHHPGLKVVVPATAAAAKGLLSAAIRDPDPVVFLEPKRLYAGAAVSLPSGSYQNALGRARVARPGDDVTVVAWGAMVSAALEAAEAAGEEGISLEVLDLQTLAPLDWEAVFSSVGRTGRLVIVQDDLPFAGVGAEVAARVAGEAFWDLDGPVLRVAPPPTPVPFAPSLEDAYVPRAAGILEAVRTLAHT